MLFQPNGHKEQSQCYSVTLFLHCVEHYSRILQVCFFFLENILTYRLSNYCPVICLIPTRYVPNIHVIYLKEAHTVRTENDHANLVNYRYSTVWLKYDRRQF